MEVGYSSMKYFRPGVLLLAAIMLWSLSATAQTPKPGPTPIASARPLADAADLLQHLYGKVVTYEDPVWVWRGDLETQPGGDPNRKWGLFPKAHGFTMPVETGVDPNLASVLQKALVAYHQQSVGTRFQVLTSKWGYHIVPIQTHDEGGSLVAASSPLDSHIYITTEERTPLQHLSALLDAIAVASGVKIELGMYRVDGFNREFRSEPASFQWGATGAVARDALIELLDKSATTFLWSLKCQPSARAEDRFCVLNMHMIEVAITDAQGKPATKVLYFDRCGDCPPVAVPQR
jgi:hypothetical protein